MSWRVMAFGVLAVGAFGAAVVLALAGASEALVAGVAGVGLIAAGVTSTSWVHANVEPEADEQERTPKGPDQRARRRVLLTGGGLLVVTAAAVSVPAARRIDQATRRLRGTEWTAGARVVDAEGQPVRASEVAVGDMLTVYPEGHVGSADSQAVLVRNDPARYTEEFRQAGWVIDGIVVLSKLCTHMACPLGLYQQQTGTLLCPCHQATFDVLGGGEPVRGPASRRLPRLPVALTADDELVARGDFDAVVGTGFWWRP